MIRALHLIGGGDEGGAKTHVLSLLKGLQTDGTRCLLVCFREGGFAKEARRLGLDIRVMTGGMRDSLRQLKALLPEFDLIHCHGSRGNLMGLLLRNGKIPVVSTVHSDYRLDYQKRPFARVFYGWPGRFALGRLSYQIGVSDEMSRRLIGRGFSPRQVFTLYNGLDFSRKNCEVFSKEELCARLGIGYTDGDVFCGIAARFDPVKNVKTFIQAAALLQKRCPRMRFLLAGNGKEEPKLRRMAQKLGICAEFLGWLPETDDFFRLLDINVLTSLSETFPYALTEGARMGCASVATRVGGIPDLIENGVSGFLVPPGDANALADALAGLYNDKALREEMGTRLLTKAARLYSLESMLQRQKEIYTAVLRKSASKKQRGVVLCGAYGLGNTGDEAVLESVLNTMRDIDPDIPLTILSRNPKETRLQTRENAIHILHLPGVIAAFRQSRLFVAGGGSLIQDVTSRRSLWFYLLLVRLAGLFGCRVCLCGCGFGPVLRKQSRRQAARVLTRHVDWITVRDRESGHALLNLGFPAERLLLSADPVLAMPPPPTEERQSAAAAAGLLRDGLYIGVAVRDWPGFGALWEELPAALESIYHRFGLTAVFIPMQKYRDTQTALRLAKNLKTPSVVVRNTGTPRQTAALFGSMQVVLAMRLHALIFSLIAGVPSAAIAYDRKVSSFMKLLSDAPCCLPDEATEKQLCDMLSAALKTRSTRRSDWMQLCKREPVNRLILSQLLGHYA